MHRRLPILSPPFDGRPPSGPFHHEARRRRNRWPPKGATQTTNPTNQASKDTNYMLNNENPAWNRFDAIVLLTSTKTKKRLDRTIPELHRVGITDFSTIIDTPSPFLDKLCTTGANLFSKWCREHISSIRVSFAHYKAVSSAYYGGANHALFLEDDVRFLKNAEDVANAAASLPEAFVFALFDHVPKNGDPNYPAFFAGLPFDENGKPNHQWRNLEVRSVCATAYALSKDGMKTFLDFYDRPTEKIHFNDFYQSPDYFPKEHSFLSTPPVAIQCLDTGTETNTSRNGLSRYHSTRQQIFKNLSDYNI